MTHRKLGCALIVVAVMSIGGGAFFNAVRTARNAARRSNDF
jgi:hypothetical protein